MADLKISQLTDGGASQATDEYVIARSGANYRIDGASVAAAATSVGTLTSLTVSGDLTVDTSTLKVDSTNNRVGIGTATPDTVFQAGTGSRVSQNWLWAAGNSANPPAALTYGVAFGHNLSNGTSEANIVWGQGVSGNQYLAIGKWTGSAYTEQMRIDSSGNLAVDTNTLYVDAANNRVGVGTASPGFQLHTLGAVTGTYTTSTSQVIASIQNQPAALGSGVNSAFLRLQTSPDAGSSNPIVHLGVVAESYGSNLSSFVVQTRDGGGITERLRVDSSGNLGLGVTPSGSAAGAFTQLQIGGGGAACKTTFFGQNNANAGGIVSNAYYDASNNLVYQASYGVSRLYLNDGTLVFSNAAAGTAGTNVSLTERARIDASGNIGLAGTTSPVASIDFGTSKANVGQIINIYSTGNSRAGIGMDSVSAAPRIFSPSNDTVVVFGQVSTSDGSTFSEKARITQGGYFKASNNGTYANATGTYHELRNSANEAAVVITNTVSSFTNDLIYGNVVNTAAGTGFKLISLNSSGVEQFRVRGDGTIFAQNTTVQSISDARLKDNVTDATDGLSVITALRPVRYDWKAGYGNDRKNQLGFIAQEVEAVFPEAVSEWSMDEPTGEVDEDGKPITEKVDYKTVGPGALIPVLVKAIQELEARIAVLEAGA